MDINLHLISDSTGETLGSISRAVLSQFPKVKVKEHMWSLVRSETQLNNVIEELDNNPGIVLYTILDKKLLNLLKKFCKKNDIVCIPALDEVINAFSVYFGQRIMQQSGRQHILDKEYFSKIEAINFTINHDDGQKIGDLEESDIIVIGPSRTSKSPTCIYLSYRGYKAANVPFVKGIDFPEKILELKKPLIVGFTLDPEILMSIRKNRLDSLKAKESGEYVSLEKIRDEVLSARRMYNKYGIMTLDVSRVSVEEISAIIIQELKSRNSD